jgi:MFS family permease
VQDGEPAAQGIREGLQLLRAPSFARLFGSRLISAFGSAMAPVAMAFAVLDLTGSAASMGLVIASQTGAQVAFQLFGGALADRGSRQRMLVLADLLSMSTQAAMAVLLFTGSAEVQTLCLLMAVNGVAQALHWPASVGLVPQVVEADRLQQANGLLSLAQSGAIGMGAASAGVLVATLGAAWAIAIDGATFAVSAALVAGMRARAQQRSRQSSLFQDLRDGWTEFTSHRWLWAIVLQFSVMLAAWQGSFAVVGPTVAKRLLGGPADWGWIAGAFGAGLLVGGMLALRVRVERPMLVATLCIFPNAIPVLLLSLPAPVPVIAAGAFLAGVGGQIFGVLWYTALHTHVAPEALSRVSAYDILGSIALVPLGEAAAGPLLEAIGTGPTLWAAACLIVLPTALVLLVPEVRSLRTPGAIPRKFGDDESGGNC